MVTTLFSKGLREFLCVIFLIPIAGFPMNSITTSRCLRIWCRSYAPCTVHIALSISLHCPCVVCPEWPCSHGTAWFCLFASCIAFCIAYFRIFLIAWLPDFIAFPFCRVMLSQSSRLDTRGASMFWVACDITTHHHHHHHTFICPSKS